MLSTRERAVADTLIQFGKNHRRGAILLGLIGLLQTWARNLAYHRHIHFIVTGDARNLISALAASGSRAPTVTPAENTVIF